MSAGALPFKISVLVFLRDEAGRLLLIRRNKAPNLGCWSPVGGKLETALGESPFECAVREVAEETGETIATPDLHLFGMISEKGYEGQSHWLMFLFDCRKPLRALPPAIDEGRFGFFARAEVDGIEVPATDRTLLWPVSSTTIVRGPPEPRPSSSGRTASRRTRSAPSCAPTSRARAARCRCP